MHAFLVPNKYRVAHRGASHLKLFLTRHPYRFSRQVYAANFQLAGPTVTNAEDRRLLLARLADR